MVLNDAIVITLVSGWLYQCCLSVEMYHLRTVVHNLDSVLISVVYYGSIPKDYWLLWYKMPAKKMTPL